MAISFSPNQVVSWDDFNALLGQHGSPGGAKSVETLGAPTMTKDQIEAFEDSHGGQSPKEYYANNPIRRYHMQDGSYIDAQMDENASTEAWTAGQAPQRVVAYHPSATFTQAETKKAAADPAQQTPGQQNEAVLNQQRAKNAALPPGQDPRYETDQERAARADATIKAQGAEAKAAAEANKPQVVAGTLNTTSPQYAVVDPATGNVTWQRNPNYQSPSPKPIDLPNTRTITWANPDGTVTTEKNPNYVKKSKIIPHPSDPTKLVNVTEDDNGNDVILPVDDKTVIKPADLPVLQAKYGQIAQGLGALAQDLNSRFARGEITEKQRNDAFNAAHQQAQTQVSEINSILDNSRAIWTGQVAQRGHSLAETQSRRAYASGIFGNAAQTGMSIAQSAGPGSGKAIAGGVAALMNIGQRYAEGMGGFRESPEVPLPTALGQAQSIGIPGFDTVYPGGGSGISETTDRGGVPRQRTPASSGTPGGMPPSPPPAAAGPAFRPPPPVEGSVAPQASMPGGQNPLVAQMAQQLQSGFGFGGSPVAAGGVGMFDPSQEASRMAGDGSDPIWEQAVRQAAQAVNQPGYAWDRFAAPATRFG